MSAMSDYLEEKFMQFMFKNNSGTLVTPGNGLWVALFTGATGLEANAPTLEITTVASAYARQQVVAANWTQTAGAVENTGEILWTTATSNWGDVSHIAVMDADALGNVLFWGALTTMRSVGIGDQFKINAGDLDITVD